MPILNTASDGLAPHHAMDPFALWAEVYDEQPNPLLSLEEDFLLQLLPQVPGLDVVDMGCGTGRWLQHLASQHPRTLVGVDDSCEMLARAEEKVGRAAMFLHADCGSALLGDGSADLCLASFVTSHVDDLERFSRQVARTLRPGGNAFITDVHPETAARLSWKRAFRYGQQSISLSTYERPIAQVISALEKQGLQVVLLLEPCFQTRQREVLLKLQKSQLADAMFQVPAIYILQVRRCITGQNPAEECFSPVRLTGARISFGPHASATAQLDLNHGSVASILSPSLRRAAQADTESLDLSGYLLLPGLINSHDHLEFGLFPNLGRGNYQNAAEWAEDIHKRDSAVIAQRRRIPKAVRCWWGAIRNLLCGATTVCHHNPLFAELARPDFPVRVLRDYEWAHSLSFDSDLATKFDGAGPDAPFVIHAGEGVDERSAEELRELERRGFLNERTVLVHALALDADTVDLLNRRCSAVVWCPTSNRFLFGNTLDGKLLSKIHSLALGSDSLLTAAGDLLDDIDFACHKRGMLPDRLYEMVYTSPARIFRMRNGEGSVKPSGVADLIAVRDKGADPAEVLAHLSGREIELVVIRSQVQLARHPIMERLPETLREGLEPLEVDGETVWLRGPIAHLCEAAVTSLHVPIQLGRKQVRYVANC